MSQPPRTLAERYERRQRAMKWMRYVVLISMFGGGIVTGISNCLGDNDRPTASAPARP